MMGNWNDIIVSKLSNHLTEVSVPQVIFGVMGQVEKPQTGDAIDENM